MGGPGIWDWGGAPRKNNNKYLNLVLKIATGGDFFCDNERPLLFLDLF